MLNSFLTFLQRHGPSYLFFALLFVMGLSGCGIFRFEAEIIPLQPEAAVSGTPQAVSTQKATPLDISSSSPLLLPQPPHTLTAASEATATPLSTAYPTLSATYLTSEAEYNRMLRESSPTPTSLPTATPTPFYAVAPVPEATNQLRFESRSMYQETPRFQITFDPAQWVVKETMLHHHYLTGCTLHTYSFWGQVRGPMQEEQVAIADIAWTVRTFPTERLLSYVSPTSERFTYVFHVTYDENADDTTISACRNAAEEVIKTFVVVDTTQPPADATQANEAQPQPIDGFWSGPPNSVGPADRATYPYLWQLQYDPNRWYIDENNTLAYVAAPACRIGSIGGHGLSPNQTHEDITLTYTDGLYTGVLVKLGDTAISTSYCTSLGEDGTCFEVNLGEDPALCRQEAEQVLMTITRIERSNP